MRRRRWEQVEGTRCSIFVVVSRGGLIHVVLASRIVLSYPSSQNGKKKFLRQGGQSSETNAKYASVFIFSS